MGVLESLALLVGALSMAAAAASERSDSDRESTKTVITIEEEDHPSSYTVPLKTSENTSRPRDHYLLTANQEYELRMAESKRLDNTCKAAIDGAMKRWDYEGRSTTTQTAAERVDNRYSKIISDIIKSCK